LLLAVVLLNGLLMPGCRRSIPLGEEIDGFVFKDEEMDNVRFEPQGLPFSIEPAHAYWLRSGDEIAPRWDTYEWHWERKSTMPMCAFVDNTSAGDCQVCDFCNPPASFDGPPCMGISTNLTFSRRLLEVVADSGFIETDNPQLVSDLRNNIFAGCSNATQGPLGFFAPAASGLYRLRSGLGEAFKIKGETNGEIKLYVVAPDSAQQTPYQIPDKLSETVNDGNGNIETHEYWTWTMGGDPLWLENFSPNLRVTNVRIFKGICADGSAQGKQCAVPTESVLVRPSRVFFLANFANQVDNYPGGTTQYRCYSAPDAADGIEGNFINLSACRKECARDATTNTCTSTQAETRDVVPTYLVDSVTGARPTEKLTWVVEFNTNEGADADLMTPDKEPMPSDAKLIIEFTIQAHN
jgi:hypothetical protein